MPNQDFQPEAELFKRIQQQFDYSPYPVTAVDNLPTDLASLYYHSLSTAFYRRNREIVEPEGRTILDVGCGSGYKTLLLALANPGAKIVGIDLSDRSLEIARQRFAHHRLEAEFHQFSLFDLPHELKEEFDYINCDEILYLMPDRADALVTLKLMLKTGGIIRGNLHSLFQRFHYYRAQEIFGMMGLMEEEIQAVVKVMTSLKSNVDLKKTWNPSYEGSHQKHAILMNYLFQGDRGYTITELFSLLDEAQLEFISMVNWQQWELEDLFESKVSWFFQWAKKLPKQQQLHVFELFHPVHRLLDFWCGMPVPTKEVTPQKVRLHPLLKSEGTKEALTDAIARFAPFDINRCLPINPQPFLIDSSVSVALIPLFEGGADLNVLAEYWRAIHPQHPMSGQRVTKEEAIALIGDIVSSLEEAGYIFCY